MPSSPRNKSSTSSPRVYSKVILAATAVILVLRTYLSASTDAPDLAELAGNAGQWSPEEHQLYPEVLATHGWGTRAWKKISVGMANARTAPKLQGSVSFSDPKSVVSKSVEAAGNASAWGAEGHSGPSELVPPPGTYAWPARRTSRPVPNHGRVLLYITSHFSAQHELFLRYCWRNSLERSPLLRGADVAVHLVPNEPRARRGAMDLLREVFADHDLTVYLRTYEGALMEGGSRHRNKYQEHLLRTKQTGAVMAMYEGVHRGYFEGYDWVIRANPDVLIRDDSFFRQAMADPALSALIVNCKMHSIHLHTDFFIVRPKVLLEEEFPEKILPGGAELSFTKSMKNTVLTSDPKNYAWIPGADPASKKACRVGEGRDFFDVPVVHEHALHPDICTVPEADAPIVESVFPHWPKSWIFGWYTGTPTHRR